MDLIREKNKIKKIIIDDWETVRTTLRDSVKALIGDIYESLQHSNDDFKKKVDL